MSSVKEESFFLCFSSFYLNKLLEVFGCPRLPALLHLEVLEVIIDRHALLYGMLPVQYTLVEYFIDIGGIQAHRDVCSGQIHGGCDDISVVDIGMCELGTL